MHHKRYVKRILSILLAIAMTVTMLPMGAFATEYVANEIPQNTDEWLREFPNGAIAFRDNHVNVDEGGEPFDLIVYRFGGTAGEVSARVVLTPLAIDGEDAYAAGWEDIALLSEEHSIVESPVSPFDNLVLDVVFQDGEWEKAITLAPMEDSLHEPVEFMLATIMEVTGTTFTEAANRLTINLHDNEETIPSVVGFAETELIADQNEASVSLKVTREKGLMYNFVVSYQVLADTAVDGVDFVAAEGELLFNSGQASAEIVVSLINDMIPNDLAEKSFTVVLSNPLSGEIADGRGTARVSLINSYIENSLLVPSLANLLANEGGDDLRADAQINTEGLFENNNASRTISTAETTAPTQPNVRVSVEGTTIQQETNPLSRVVLPGNPDLASKLPSGGAWTPLVTIANANKRSDLVIRYSDAQMQAARDVGNAVLIDHAKDWTIPLWKTVKSYLTFGWAAVGDDVSAAFHRMQITTAADRTEMHVVMRSNPVENMFFLYKKLYVNDVRLGGEDTNAEWDYAFGLTADRTPEASFTYDIQNHMLGRTASKDVVLFFSTESTLNANYFGPSGEASRGRVDMPETLVPLALSTPFDLADYYSNAAGYGSDQATALNTNQLYMAITDTNQKGPQKQNRNIDIREAYFERAVMPSLSIEVNGLTSSDKDLIDSNVSNSAFAASVVPQFSFLDGKGGVDASGKFYIGSTLQIKDYGANAMLPYKIKSVQLLNGSTVINTGTQSNTNDWTIALLPSITATDPTNAMNQLSCLTTSGSYTLRVEVERVQTITVDLTPVTKYTFNSTGTDLSGDAINLQAYVTNQVNYKTSNAAGTAVPGTKADVNFVGASNKIVSFSATGLESINLGNAYWTVVYDGKMWRGDVDIPLSSAYDVSVNDSDYRSSNVSFLVYHVDEISNPQPVKIQGVKTMQVYLDANDNGRIDADDTLSGALLPGGRYDEAIFAPQNSHRKILRIVYYAIPHQLQYSATNSDYPADYQADLTPYFFNSNTTETYLGQLYALAPQMLERRSIAVDPLASYNGVSNGKHAIYGPAAAEGRIDIPLGGNTGFEGTKADGKGGYEYVWENKYVGNLTATAKTGYGDVTSLSMPHDALGAYQIAKTNEEVLNFLGSFQSYDAPILKLTLKEKTAVTENEAYFDQTFQSRRKFIMTEVEPIAFAEVGAPSEPEGTRDGNPKARAGDSGGDKDTPQAEPSMKFPTISVPLGPVDISMSTNEIAVQVGIPAFGKTNGSAVGSGGGEQTGKMETVTPKSYGSELGKMFSQLGKGGDDDVLNKLQEAKDGKSTANHNYEFSITAGFVLVFTYDEDVQAFQFDKSLIMVGVSGGYTFTYRIPAFPLAYVYVSVGGSLQVGMLIDVFEERDKATGYVYRTPRVGGFTIEASAFFEVGAGIGAEGMKFEIFINISVGASFVFGQDGVGSRVANFTTTGAFGFRVVFLCFSYQMDVIGYKVEFDGYEENPAEQWSFTLLAAGQDITPERRGVRTFADQPMQPGEQVDTSVSMLRRRYNEQQIGAPAFQTFAFADEDFSLGTLNGNSTKTQVLDGASSGDYALASIGDEVYVFYTIDGGGDRADVHADMLVFSKLKADGSGIVNPIDEESLVPYAPVLDDKTRDSDFSVSSDSATIYIAWTNFKSGAAPGSSDPIEIIEAIRGDTEIAIATFDGSAITMEASTGETGHYNYAANMETASGGARMTAYLEAQHYTPAERQQRAADRFLSDENTSAAENGAAEYMDALFGRYADIKLSYQADAESTAKTIVLPLDENDKLDTTVTQLTARMLDANNFAVAYTLDQKAEQNGAKVMLKKLYLHYGTIVDGVPMLDESRKLVSTLVDFTDKFYNDLDGIYEGTTLEANAIDPNFGSLQFEHAKINPGGSAENILLLTMNANNYVLDNAALTRIRQGDTFTLKPFFTIDPKKGDGRGDFTLGADKDGNIVCVYLQNNGLSISNAIFIAKYDPVSETWGEGRVLAMRDMETYEKGLSGELTTAQMREKYEVDTNQVTFTGPGLEITKDGDVVVLTEVTKTALSKVLTGEKDGDKDKFFMAPVTNRDGAPVEPDKGIFALTYQNAEKKLSNPSLTFDNEIFVPGNLLTPNIRFTNTGDAAIYGDATNPIALKVMMGEADLAAWQIEGSILSGETFDLQAELMAASPSGTLFDMLTAITLPGAVSGTIYFTLTDGKGWEYKSDGVEGASYTTNSDNQEFYISDVTAYFQNAKNADGDPGLYLAATVGNAGAQVDGATLKLSYVPYVNNKPETPVSIASYPVDKAGSSIIRDNLDEKITPNGDGIPTSALDKDNDLYIKPSYFTPVDGESKVVLRLEVVPSDGTEYNTENNVYEFKLGPPVVITAEGDSLDSEGMIDLTTGTQGTVTVTGTDISGKSVALEAVEILNDGGETLLSQNTVAADKLSLKATKAGTTTVRVREASGMAYIDLPVRVTGQAVNLGEFKVAVSDLQQSGGNFTNENRTVSFKAASGEHTLKGLAVTNEKGEDVSFAFYNPTGNYSFSAPANGTYTITFTSANTGDTVAEKVTVTGIDKEKPKLAYKITDDGIQYTASDTGGSGLASVTIDNTPDNVVNPVEQLSDADIGEESFEDSLQDPAKTVVFTLTDRAGNKHVETIVLSGKVSSLSLSEEGLSSKGGNVTATVQGTQLEGTSIWIYVNGVRTKQASIFGDTATATIKLPANSSDQDQTYAITVYVDNALVEGLSKAVVVEKEQTSPPSGTGGSSGGTPSSNATIRAGENGSVTISPSKPAKGDLVTVTVRPNQGFELDQLTVKDANGKELPLTKLDEQQYTYTQPDGKVTIAASFKASRSGENPFLDVKKSDWFYDAVCFVQENGLFSGTSSTSFSPNDTMTRDMLATVLWRLAGTPKGGNSVFTDVPPNTWFTEAVAWAEKNGIVTGYGQGLFGPGDKISREQFVVMLFRYATWAKMDVTARAELDDFVDQKDISGYALEAMRWAVALGLVEGKNGSVLDPGGDATRAEAAAILQRFLSN